ncbi:MAG: extracellular solute-binding protein [Clostridiaceae bacterium]
MKKARLLAFILACVLAVSVAGCGSNPGTTSSGTTGDVAATSATTDTTSTEEGAAKSEKPTYPLITPGSETLTVATMDNWFATKSYNNNLPVYQELEKLTGVTIKWEATPVNDYDQVMTTRLASGANLPDVFVVPWDSNPDKLGIDGISIPMNNLIKDNAYYLNMLMNFNPSVRSGITAADGNIYAYPGFGEGLVTSAAEMESGNLTNPGANICPNVSAIRKDWLDKLGLKMPETLDDWYNILKAFKTQDPNGNKKADEIPVTATFNIRDIYRFGEAFGLYRSGNAEGRWDVDANGKIYFKDIDTRFKQTLEFLNKLYNEGLLDPEYASAGFSKTSEKINRNLVGAVTSDWMSNFGTYNANLKTAGVADANWVPVKPIKNPDGKSLITNRWSVWKTMAISKSCKNPELAMKWIDIHTLSPEGIRLQTLGVEGLSYKMENGKPVLTEMATKNPDGIGPQEYLRSLGAWGQVSYVQTKEAYEVLWADQPDIIAFAAKFPIEDIRDPFPTGLPFSDEETDIRTEFETNINTYCDEMAIKFIEGKESLDKFDAYVEGVKKYGLEELTAAYQSAYERFMSAK